jgi:hypothetical protein
MLVLLVAASVSAYTLVMKDGRRREIPSRFVVTRWTLTYEVQPGIQVTLQMSTIDLAQTEKANNEPAGALLRRSQSNVQRVTSVPSQVSTPSARKTITNRDLEAAALRRVASEQAYEKRVMELGLPPLDESRRQAEADAALAQSELRERLAMEKQSEDYWRGRANDLRTEMAALDAELGYVRTRLDEVPDQSGSGSFTTATSIGPFIEFGNFGRERRFPGHRGYRQPVYSAPRGIGPQHSGRVGLGRGTTRDRRFIYPGQVGPFGRRSQVGIFPGSHVPLGAGVGILPNATVFGSSPIYDYSYERNDLITRFNDLAAARAGLNARWRALEDEARRAGVLPGWLRP